MYTQIKEMVFYFCEFSLFRYDSAQQYGTYSVPVLMVGTKLDLIADGKRSEISRRSALVADDYGSSEIYLVRIWIYLFTNWTLLFLKYIFQNHKDELPFFSSMYCPSNSLFIIFL